MNMIDKDTLGHTTIQIKYVSEPKHESYIKGKMNLQISIRHHIKVTEKKIHALFTFVFIHKIKKTTSNNKP